MSARFRQIAGMFVVARGTLLALVAAVVAALPERAPNPNKDYVAFPASALASAFARWDAGWYNRIVQHGYYFEGKQSDVAFFPAYPYLTRAVGAVLGNTWAAGLLLSNLCLLGSLFFVDALARKHMDDDAARRAVLFVLVFPTSIFFSAFYAESLFLLCVAAAFYFYEEDRLVWAGLCGGVAALTRSTGILLFPALVVGALHRAGYRVDRKSVRLLWLLLIPAGLGIFMWILARQVGDPLAFLSAQSGWNRQLTNPLVTLFFAFPSAHGPIDVLDTLAAIGLLIAGGFAYRRLGPAHAIFCLLTVLLSLSSGRTMSMARFALGVVPLFLMLAVATQRRAVEQLVIYGFTVGLILDTTLYARWYWAG